MTDREIVTLTKAVSEMNVWQKRTLCNEFFQFTLLADLCSMSRDIVFDALVQFNTTHSIATRMLLENEIERQVNSTSYFTLVVDAPKLLERGLLFVRESIRWNGFASGLNTNFGISVNGKVDEKPSLNIMQSSISDASGGGRTCTVDMCSTSASFYELNFTTDSWQNWFFLNNYSHFYTSDYARGFSASTTVLEALRQSSLDCLYEWTCLHLLEKYFPLLTQVCDGDDGT